MKSSTDRDGITYLGEIIPFHIGGIPDFESVGIRVYCVYGVKNMSIMLRWGDNNVYFVHPVH